MSLMIIIVKYILFVLLSHTREPVELRFKKSALFTRSKHLKLEIIPII